MSDALSAQANLAAATATAPRAVTGGHVSTEAEAKAAGVKFEAMFMSQMLQQMYSGVKSNGPFGGGQGEEMFRPMLLDEYGKIIAKHGNGMGMSDAVARTLMHLQEGHR